MKVTPLSSADSIKRIHKSNNVTSPIQNSVNNSYNPNTIFNVYFGKDLVSFKGTKSFEQTLKENYFCLPEGCHPDAFQVEAGKALNEGRDVLVEAPTGTGKTAIAYYATSKNMDAGKTTFYTTPLKALSNQKMNEFKALFGEENVGILTGDRRENVDAPIIIMTTEVYRNMALSNAYGDKNPLMENLGTVIFDEFHYLGDDSRGPVWEESLMFTPKDVQTLKLSATIGNSEELKKWVGHLDDDNITLVSIPSSARHVPLQFDTLQTNAYKQEEKRIQKSIKKIGYVPNEVEDSVSSKPTLSDFKCAVDKLSKKEQLPAIFFVFSRKFSRELLEYLSQESKDLTTAEEKEEIFKILDKHKANNYIGADLDVEALKKGYAIHNAGIIPTQKALIEELFQKKLIKVVIATETLAAGINMPAKTVVISSPFKPTDAEDAEEGVRTLTANEFKQMSGRAGRRGIDTVGYVYTMPTDRLTETEFLNLEAMDSNPIHSKYTPDYSFLSGYYEYNNDSEELESILEKSFYAYSDDENVRAEKQEKLLETADLKSQILLERGFLTVDDDGSVDPTMLGSMASKVRGYDAITLVEAIDSKKFDGITPEALAMVAGAIANPAKGNEQQITLETDLSDIFDSVQDSVEGVHKYLSFACTKRLKKFGKTPASFASYTDMIEFVKNLKAPDANARELKNKRNVLKERRDKVFRIIEIDDKMTTKQLVAAIKASEVIPTRVLEEHFNVVERYKKKIKAADIDSHIEKLTGDLEAQGKSAKGAKAKAKSEKIIEELKADIKEAEDMKFLDEHIMTLMSDNHQFIKKYPPYQVEKDLEQAENMYARLAKRSNTMREIEGLMNIEAYTDDNDIAEDCETNLAKSSECFKELIKKAMEVFETETANGVQGKSTKYNKTTAQIAINWAYLNRISSDSMSNWRQLLKAFPEEDADEGSIYRSVMQTADLLSQIAEITAVGMEKAQTPEEYEYYTMLNDTAHKARSLMIKEPVEI